MAIGTFREWLREQEFEHNFYTKLDNYKNYETHNISKFELYSNISDTYTKITTLNEAIILPENIKNFITYLLYRTDNKKLIYLIRD